MMSNSNKLTYPLYEQTVTMKMLPLDEYKQLIAHCQKVEQDRDEIRLKYTKKLEQTTEYEKEIEELKDQLKKKDDEIRELKETIQQLKQTIEQNSTEINALKQTVDSKSTKIDTLKQTVDIKSTEIKTLTDDVNKLKLRDQMSKFTIAIQDLNASDKLEQNPNIKSTRYLHTFKKSVSQNLFMRNNRNSGSHYFRQ